MVANPPVSTITPKESIAILVIPSIKTVKSSYIRVQEAPATGLDKPRGCKRHLSNAGVNFRPIPPI